jgi:DNA-directed RNA polymerase subunit RPC12/RpoP
MKCESCGIVIKPEFTHAINNNQCPACGKPIMQKAKLAAFLSLRTLLDSQIVVKGVDIDKLASLIMANFEVKQLFQEGPQPALQNEAEEGIMEVSEEETVAVEEEEEDSDPDAEYKQRQQAEAKEILKKMRDEVLAGAVKDRYGFGEEDNITLDLLDDEVDPHEFVNKQMQQQRQEMIQNGTGGAFRRSE